MKIVDLISKSPIGISNEEYQLYKSCDDRTYLDSLSDRQKIIAQNLVKKGLFNLTKDKKYLIKIK